MEETMDITRITAEEVREALDYDQETGVLRWRYRASMSRRWNTRYAGTVAGSVAKNGYRYIQLGKGHHFGAHVLAWIHFKGIVPAEEIDHENGRRDENWIDNLREAPDGANSINRARARNNTSGIVGVSFDPQRRLWRARVNRNGDMHDGGFFASKEAAASARKELAAKVYGEFATRDPDREKFFHWRDAKHD